MVQKNKHLARPRGGHRVQKARHVAATDNQHHRKPKKIQQSRLYVHSETLQPLCSCNMVGERVNTKLSLKPSSCFRRSGAVVKVGTA